MNLTTSLWLISTSFVRQSGGVQKPISLSARALLFFWWIFVLVVTSVYTANLTAHLTFKYSASKISGVEDLLYQSELKWGVLADTSVETSFHSYGGDYSNLVSRGIRLSNFTEVANHVKAGQFVFIGNEIAIDFNFADVCDAVTVPTGKFSTPMAIGLQPKSPYKRIIDKVLLKYREKGWLDDVSENWLKRVSSCPPPSIGNNMSIDTGLLTGIYSILMLGVGISFVVLVLETLCAAHHDRQVINEGFLSALKRRFILKKIEILEEWCGVSNVPITRDLNGQELQWMEQDLPSEENPDIIQDIESD